MMKMSGLSRIALVASLALASPALAATQHHTAAAASGANTGKIGATPVPTAPTPVPTSPAGDKSTPTPPTLPDMTAYVLMDAKTGAILAEAAPHLQLPPASLTKLMTAHLVYQAIHHGSLKMDQVVPVSVKAWHQPGSTMFIQPNSVVTVNQLLHGLIIDSGNDAAVALAQQVAGSTDVFVQMMNSEANKLGLSDTHYANPTGLPNPDLHTSAMDVAKLTRTILHDEPEILDISKLKTYTYDKITQRSWNPVLFKDPTVDGLKTGLTDESGHCIDATALRGNMRLIAVVTGGPTWPASTAAIESLLDYGQRFFTDAQITTAGQQIDTLKSDALNSGEVPVGVSKDVTVTLPVDAEKAITHNITYTADLTPGVTKGEVLGTVTYSAKGKTLATVPVIALADSPRATFFTKLKNKLRKML
ncbi:D-alanyl-D-alanine carboxypeptidase family protein [Acidocella aminolytica]|uniref:serine-type D-Ala-D-Ala carboxypeptidase n=1 Tax=Acidocella aminolytica 101 = DSM 11237 TaxID=1120923 RepID=A0A0D6PD49_9PROT|nr:D-alanyl-D-alanine carboxypeptidase family protein [Acidocella aminolytica]GAN79281.1 D-alanyl-D-alanine serine-type carboxypeptidase [Acidocella aminolytica 101 = DSM 11237]SHE37498.1 D-alanyl-D-alanine carboxypeptidase (penicillin-binding protein 5/6) [Acidocella aminolytica 101 = DSM 11237]